MNRTEYLPLAFILLTSLSFRLFINYFIPINQQLSLIVIFMGLVNLTLVFNITQRLINYKVGLLAALLYAISPWTAYLEVAASPYITLLTFLLVLYIVTQVFGISKNIYLILLLLIVIIFIYIFNQFTIFSNIGLLNTVNEYRGETNQTIFAPIAKVVENKYIYFSEHLLFNTLKQFTPATYFTNQIQLLGFSFSPPIYLGFLIPFLFGLAKLSKKIFKARIYEITTVFLLVLPSILLKDSPNLPALVLVSPIIFLCISIGLYEFIENPKNKIFRLLLVLTISLVALQFFTTLSDIAIREPVRFESFKNNG